MVIATLKPAVGLVILFTGLTFVCDASNNFPSPPEKICEAASAEAPNPFPGECGRFGRPSRSRRRTPYIVGGESVTWGKIPWQVGFAINEY